MNGTTKRFVARLALLGLFLAQLATAAYACPLIEAAMRGAPAPQVEMAAPCDGMTMDEPVVMTAPCLDHCNVGLQLVDTNVQTHQLPCLSTHALIVVPLPTTLSSIAASTAPLLARAASPPVFASSNRLRI